MIPVILYLLAVMDCAFMGYRAAAARNALINKRRYYTRAMLRGAALGNGAVLIAFVLVQVLLATAPLREIAYRELIAGGERLVWVYAPYAGIVLVGFVFRMAPSTDIRSMMNILIFGPFTLIRWPVVLSGAGLACVSVPSWRVWVFCAVIVGLMRAAELTLNRWHSPRAGVVGAPAAA
ncbi:MAG: hypothetical protein IT462_12580 [Planctomycetes bacterium]|nr:hypothetical protein [Planctomycetota bacterium]